MPLLPMPSSQESVPISRGILHYPAFRFNVKSIDEAMKFTKMIMNFLFNNIHIPLLDEIHDSIYKRTKQTTMVATGHLLSKLYYRRRRLSGALYHLSVGYNPTRLNQSVAQELELKGGVHRNWTNHFNEFGEAICSRTPEDLYAFYGYRYKANPSARRGALSLSAQEVIGSQIDGIENDGSNIAYAIAGRLIYPLGNATGIYLHNLGTTQ